MNRPDIYTKEVEDFLNKLSAERVTQNVPLCLYVEYGMSRSRGAECFKYWKETRK